MPQRTILDPTEREAVEWASEESSELVQAAMKLCRHGKDPLDASVDPPVAYDNVAALNKEAADVVATLLVLQHLGLVETDSLRFKRNVLAKLREVRRHGWLHSVELGPVIDRLEAEVAE